MSQQPQQQFGQGAVPVGVEEHAGKAAAAFRGRTPTGDELYSTLMAPATDPSHVCLRVLRDSWSPLLTPAQRADVVLQNTLPTTSWVNLNFTGQECWGGQAFLTHMEMLKASIPDIHCSFLFSPSIIHQEDSESFSVFCRWVKAGCYSGSGLLGSQANNKVVYLHGISLCRVKNMKLTHMESYTDMLGFLKMLGVALPAVLMAPTGGFGGITGAASGFLSSIGSSISSGFSSIKEAVGMGGGGGSTGSTGTSTFSGTSGTGTGSTGSSDIGRK